MGHHHECDVMMPTCPAPSFKMIQAQLLFQLLVILFHPPAPSRDRHQPLQTQRLGQITKVILGGLGFTRRPFDEQPDLFAGRLAVAPAVELYVKPGIDVSGVNLLYLKSGTRFTTKLLTARNDWTGCRTLAGRRIPQASSK